MLHFVSRTIRRCVRPRAFGAFLVAASGALCLWFSRYGLPTPDAGAALVHAVRLARGAVFYRDLDAYPLPAASYLLALAMRIFGENLAVGRALAAVTYTAILMACYGLTLELGGRRSAALCGLAVLSLKFLAWPAFQDALYPDTALCFALCSMLAWFRFHRLGQARGLAVAGLLAGLTLLCKQNLGLYLGFAMGVLTLTTPPAPGQDGARTAIRRLATFGGAAAAPIAVAAFYFWWHGVFGRMLYSGLVRPFSGYLPTSGMSFAVPLEWWRLGELKGMAGFAYSIGPLWEMLGMSKLPLPSFYPQAWLVEEAIVRLLYTAVPLVFVAAVAVLARDRHDRQKRDTLAALVVLALATLASAFPRADYYHLASVYPMLLVLAFVMGSRALGAMRPGALRSTAVVAGSVLTISALLATLVLSAIYFRGMTFEAGNARGRMRIYPENAWIQDVLDDLDAKPGDHGRLFVYGHEAYYYFLSDRFAPWPFVQLYPGMTGEDGGKALVEALDSAPPDIILKGLIAGWPGLPDVNSYAGALKDYVFTHYQPTTRPFSDGIGPDAPPPPPWLFEVLERRPAAR
jgi:hypothetical protein